MTAICFSPPIQRSSGVNKLLVREAVISPEFQSPERRSLAKLTGEIWQDLTIFERRLAEPEDLDTFDYVTVPPKRVFKVKARYRFQGRISPQPYHLDDE
jgi:hypothetical protein